MSLFCSVQIHTVRGTAVLQQYVDKQQLPTDMDGDFAHCHSDWLVFRLVRNRCFVFFCLLKYVDFLFLSSWLPPPNFLHTAEFFQFFMVDPISWFTDLSLRSSWSWGNWAGNDHVMRLRSTDSVWRSAMCFIFGSSAVLVALVLTDRSSSGQTVLLSDRITG